MFIATVVCDIQYESRNIPDFPPRTTIWNSTKSLAACRQETEDISHVYIQERRLMIEIRVGEVDEF
jgi:hypothetical protein